MSLQESMEEYERRRIRALAMGGPDKLARRRQAGMLNARQRVDYLVDPGSFLEWFPPYFRFNLIH